MGLPATEAVLLEWAWWFWAREKQQAPPGDWLVWMLRTGRGFGKTRSGAMWSHERAEQRPGRWMAWIGKTPKDIRRYMVEGPGGILKNTMPNRIADAARLPRSQPFYEPSKLQLTWPNGTVASLFSSEDADALRGFSGDTAWVDEFLKYKNPREVWDNLQFGMREASDDQPRICITTTPRPHPILSEIESLPTTRVVTGSSYENKANLDARWLRSVLQAYEGTNLGDQEIWGKIVDAQEGRVYYAFNSDNIDDSIKDTGAEILIGQDFNVNPMCSVIAVRAGDECLVLDALRVPTSNTEELTEEYKRRYPGRKVIVCPDPSGKQRRTSAPVGQTDFTILERAGFEVRAPDAAPLVVDRENNTNALFSRNKVRVHPRAKPLIEALNGLTYKEGTSIRDKNPRLGYDHPCDALDYLLWSEFNVLEEAAAPVRTFRWRV